MDLSRLHPQARSAVRAQIRSPLTVDNLDGVRRSMADAAAIEVGPGPAVATVHDVDAGGVPARWYEPAGADRDAVMLYAHGGGWVLGDLGTHDGLCRTLAVATGAPVLAVDYRLAPEHPYPAAVEDMEKALDWLRQENGDRPVIAAGDSAGGHLAAVLARRHPGRVRAQVLICPALDPALDYPELDAYGLHTDEMRFFWDAFCPDGLPDPDHPLRFDPAGMPPAVVITAELDVLRDEGEAYARRLYDAGVPVVSARYQGMNHNFVRKLALFDAAPVAVAQIAAALRVPGFGTGSTPG